MGRIRAANFNNAGCIAYTIKLSYTACFFAKYLGRNLAFLQEIVYTIIILWSIDREGVKIIALSNRQKQIAEIVRLDGPITGEHIAERLNVTRAALRSDLAILVMGGILDARPKVGYFYTGKNTLGMLMEEISAITVQDLQSVPVAITQDKSAYEAVVTMFLEDVGTVFVLDEAGLLTGIVSRKDLLKAAINNSDLRDIPVVMVMTPISKIIVATPEEAAASAARRLIDNEIDCLPVVKILDEAKRNYKVVGRITKTNFTRLLVDLAEGKGGNYHTSEA